MESKRNAKLRTWEEKKLLCEQWKTSGKTKIQFCKDNNIPVASFYPWCSKLWPETKKQEANILPIKIINKASILSENQVAQTEIELIFGEGPTVRFKLPIKNLVPFILELSHAVTTIR